MRVLIEVQKFSNLKISFIFSDKEEGSIPCSTQELLRREQVYRGTRLPVQLKDQVVILIDDGLATGASMMAAIHAVRRQAPARIVVAVPVAPVETVETVEAQRSEVNEVICPLIPDWMMSIGYWYLDFPQTSDEEVIDLLTRAWQRESATSALAQGDFDA